jgi:Notch-like protein
VCNCSSTGYSGPYCEVELNHCTGTVCENGGTCLDQPGGFLCQCPPGFYGFTCSNVIPTARSDPTPRNIDVSFINRSFSEIDREIEG